MVRDEFLMKANEVSKNTKEMTESYKKIVMDFAEPTDEDTDDILGMSSVTKAYSLMDDYMDMIVLEANLLASIDERLEKIEKKLSEK